MTLKMQLHFVCPTHSSSWTAKKGPGCGKDNGFRFQDECNRLKRLILKTHPALSGSCLKNSLDTKELRLGVYKRGIEIFETFQTEDWKMAGTEYVSTYTKQWHRPHWYTSVGLKLCYEEKTTGKIEEEEDEEEDETKKKTKKKKKKKERKKSSPEGFWLCYTYVVRDVNRLRYKLITDLEDVYDQVRRINRRNIQLGT